MKHYGDICKINGADVEPVNVVIGGSPCQGLSVAGKQEGLADERSVLYIEQLRVIKEMRRADIERGRKGADIRPRFMVWENVPGAFSSNNRTDFASVLQETIKVVCEQTPSVPIPKNGWPSSGCLTDLGGQWSIAWRVLDAQFWGVPQRRKRIALVADFGGLTAPEILFERQGVPGYIEPCGEKRKRTSGNIEKGIDTTITARGGAYCIQGNSIDRSVTAGCNGKGWIEGVSYTLNTIDRPAVLPFETPPLVFEPGSCTRVGGHIWQDGKAPSLRANAGDNQPAIAYEKQVLGFPLGFLAENTKLYDETATTICNGTRPGFCNGVVIALEHHPHDCRIKIADDGTVQTLNARMGTGGGNVPLVLCMKTTNLQTTVKDAEHLKQAGAITAEGVRI